MRLSEIYGNLKVNPASQKEIQREIIYAIDIIELAKAQIEDLGFRHTKKTEKHLDDALLRLRNFLQRI